MTGSFRRGCCKAAPSIMNMSVYSYNCVIFLWKLCGGSRFRWKALIHGRRPALSSAFFKRGHLVPLSETAEVYCSGECKGTRLSGTNMDLFVRAPPSAISSGRSCTPHKGLQTSFLNAWPFHHVPKPCPIVRVSHAQSLGCLEILGRRSSLAGLHLRSSVRRGCGMFSTQVAVILVERIGEDMCNVGERMSC